MQRFSGDPERHMPSHQLSAEPGSLFVWKASECVIN